MLQDFHYLRELDGDGSSDEEVTEKLGNQRNKTILLRELAVPERSDRAAQINPKVIHFAWRI
jgi:hypothetical protein